MDLTFEHDRNRDKVLRLRHEHGAGSASVRRTDSLQVLEHLLRRLHVAVLGIYVVEVGLMGLFVAVPYRFARDYWSVAVLEGVNGGRADAAGGRGAGDNKGVHPGGG